MVSADRPGPSTRTRVWTLDGDTEVRRRDSLVTEEPLESLFFMLTETSPDAPTSGLAA